MNNETIHTAGEFTLNLPKAVYTFRLAGQINPFMYVHEPAKYPNAWNRFWLRFFLGWKVERAK